MANFEMYAQEGNEFLKQVAIELGSEDDREHAFRVTQAVFHALRDRITIEESMNLISELPMMLKALYVHEWDISQERKRYSSRHEFLKEVSAETQTGGIDFGSNPKEESQAVFRAVRTYISEGEMANVKGQLPKDIADLMEA